MVVLASASPRRRALLKQVGLSFEVQASDVDETIPEDGVDPERFCKELALRKAQAVASQLQEAIVIGADTVVVRGDKVLGKPVDKEDARRMLRALRGKTHRVITGVAVVNSDTGRYLVDSEVTRVKMRPYSDSEISAYLATGEPMDKAGAYGIQGRGALLVEGIHGCYYNVVGLPLVKVARMLAQFHVQVWSQPAPER